MANTYFGQENGSQDRASSTAVNKARRSRVRTFVKKVELAIASWRSGCSQNGAGNRLSRN